MESLDHIGIRIMQSDLGFTVCSSCTVKLIHIAGHSYQIKLPLKSDSDRCLNKFLYHTICMILERIHPNHNLN
jgi:hypothetical protein